MTFQTSPGLPSCFFLPGVPAGTLKLGPRRWWTTVSLFSTSCDWWVRNRYAAQHIPKACSSAKNHEQLTTVIRVHCPFSVRHLCNIHRVRRRRRFWNRISSPELPSPCKTLFIQERTGTIFRGCLAWRKLIADQASKRILSKGKNLIYLTLCLDNKRTLNFFGVV